jgi:HK97 family phage prohead protease
MFFERNVKMKADFSGYATKAGLKCSDGLTIMPGAFKHQDTAQVPLVWQHDHNNVKNVLGHAILEHREDGVIAHCFFNDTDEAKHAKALVQHKDITMLSIWANELIKRSQNVVHGVIREVSLVLSGANPGAVIQNVHLQHDGEDIELEDEAIIFTGLEFMHDNLADESTASEDTIIEDGQTTEEGDEDLTHAATGPDATVREVYESMTKEQQDVVHYLIAEAIGASEEDPAEAADDLKQDNLDPITADDNGTTDPEGNEDMTKILKHNVFETQGEVSSEDTVLAHDAMREIFSIATSGTGSSLRSAVDQYALAHGITNIDQLFPDAQMLGTTPEWLKRRTEWVDMFLSAASKSPFSRIKTMYADITEEDARAKGYIKGTLKREEFFSVAKRVTTPTTIYKKQKIDRDDMIDITDFDVVTWLKAEMRIMIDEELARAALLGDGRDVSSEDKINEQNIRPIATDHELYSVLLLANIDDALSSVSEIIETIILNRFQYKGTGTPYFFTSETYIAKFLLLKDSTGRRIYKNLEELAADLRVAGVVPVEAMEEYADLIGIIVNPVDYRFGADRGGQVTMFDDFDIDYNQNKYLIETRTSGALGRLKSALVIKKASAGAVLVVPTIPTFNQSTGVITIPTVTGVTYKRGDTDATVTAGAMTALAAGANLRIYAVPASASYYFSTSEDDSWVFSRDES